MYQDDRYTLTEVGQNALDAGNLKADLPTIYAAVEAMSRSGSSPAHIARHAAASGASDCLTRQIENAAHALQAE